MTRTTRFWLQHPIKAMDAFWQGFSSRDHLGDTVAQEQERLLVLCNAIGLYKFIVGSFPSQLEELCFNTRDVPGWGTGFIRWRGLDTFVDSFGHAYQYACDGESYVLRAPGVDKAKARQQQRWPIQ